MLKEIESVAGTGGSPHTTAIVTGWMTAILAVSERQDVTDGVVRVWTIPRIRRNGKSGRRRRSRHGWRPMCPLLQVAAF